jgi:site-specific recombinase XerD
MRDYIRKSPALGISNIRGVSTFKEFLTDEEIKLLFITKCDNENVQNAFLFSCLTGVRACDLIKLKSSDINEWQGIKHFTIIQEKTKKKVIVPIPEIAFQFLGSFLGDRLFNLPSYGCRNKLLKTWMTKAGIDKHITFNCARHSFAMILATKGVNDYGIKKGLGHKTSGATDNYLHYNKTSLNQQKSLINSCFTETLPNDENDIGIQSLYISTTNLKIV